MPHALGEPGNVLQQRTILHDLLSLTQTAPVPGLVVDLPYQWKRGVYSEVSDWTRVSDACAKGLRETTECVDKPV